MVHRKLRFGFSLIPVIGLLVLVVMTAHCGGSGGSLKASYPNEVTPEIQAMFKSIEAQYRRRHYDYAFSGYETFLQKYGYNKLSDEALYKQGKIFLLTKRYDASAAKLKELAKVSPSALYRAKAFHTAGYAYFKLDNQVEAMEMFNKVDGSLLPTKLRIQYLSLVIETAKQVSAERDSGYLARLKLLSLYDDIASQSLRNMSGGNIIGYSQARVLVESWVDEPMKSSAIPLWMKKFPKSSSARPYIDFKVGKTYYEEGLSKKARVALSKFVTNYPKNMYSPTAQKWLVELGGIDKAVADVLKKGNYKVGVLLPLTGRYESYGMSILDGIKCAAGTENVCGDFSGVELVVKEAGLTPGAVRAAVYEFAKENVVAVIGPITGKLSIEAGIAASEKHIPIFPITQKSGLMGQGDYIFQIGMEPKQQVDALVKAAWSRGHRNFGVFFPNNNYGRTMSGLFEAGIKEKGGRITAKAEYKKRSPDLFSEVRKLKRSIGRIGAPGKGIGFDALFIPDSYQNINAIVGGLEFNGIKDVPLIGTNAWNDPGLTLLIGKNYPGSFFVDLYDGHSKGKKVVDFKNKFESSFGRSPRVLEAYGYDAMMIIRTVASNRGSGKIKSALEEHMGYSGVTGIRGFNMGSGPVIESMVLRINKKGAAE